MKSAGNAQRLRLTAWFRLPVVTPYKDARSESSITFCFAEDENQAEQSARLE